MAVVKLLGFGGMVPVTDDRLLPDTAAALSQNTFLYTGSLVGIVKPKYVRSMSNLNYGKAFRIPKNYFDAEHIEDSYWMEFVSIDTDIVRSPTVSDAYDRYYWASPLESPHVNSLARIQAGSPGYLLGVPQPSAAPTISSIIGGTGINEDRSYVVTFVTAFKEEGPPSLPSAVTTGKNDATWNLGLPTALPADITNNNLSTKRIYRTVAGQDTAAFFFVAEVPIANTTYADTALSSVIVANEQLASTTWTAPPSDLIGLITMPNGMIAGWRGSELWFCEPFRPHAWPAAYTTVVEYPIVGLGIINQTLVICTAGYPITATGIHPSAISMSKLASFEPCMSRGSILSVPEGVLYASPNGLVLVANGAAALITDNLIQKDEWNNFNKVATLRATRLSNAYYAWGSKRVGFMQPNAFQTDTFQQDDFAGATKGMFLDPSNPRISFNTLTTENLTVNVFNDSWSGETMILRNDKLFRLDMADLNFEREASLWRSKIFQSPDKKDFAAMRIYFEVPNYTRLTDAFTELLLHFDGSNGSTAFLDEIGHSFTAVGNAQLSTAQAKFGVSSALFDGTGDAIVMPYDTMFATGTADFTFDLWFYCTAASGTTRYLLSQDVGGGAAGISFRAYRDSATNKLVTQICIGTTSYTVSSLANYDSTTNTGWHHLAFVRNGSSMLQFIDGVLQGTTTIGTGAVNNIFQGFTVGADDPTGATGSWLGYIDEFRFSSGTARWTANFTPPSIPYSNIVVLGDRNTDLEQELATNQYGLTRVYADSRLVMTRELRTSGELMRLPSGFKADYWQVEIESRIKVNSIQFATSVKELAKA